jgi:glycerol-1-phosphatase
MIGERPLDASSAAPEVRSALTTYDALLLDLDGVVYRGPDPVPHAVASIRAARAAGVATAFVTNNASRPPREVADHLRALGIEADPHDVVTSAQAGAREVAARVAPGSRVLAVGGPGVAEALRARGLLPVAAAADDPSAVLMGYGPDVSWRHLAEASYAVERGAILVATNTDMSIPTAQGVAPGNGTLVAAVVAATGAEPLVAGKPFAALMTESVERVGARRPLVVGDRLDTDIEAGHASGIPSLLVLTGVTSVGDLLDAVPLRRPTYVSADLRGLTAALESLSFPVSPQESRVGLGRTRDGLADLRDACVHSWSALDAGLAPPIEAGTRAELERVVATALRL